MRQTINRRQFLAVSGAATLAMRSTRASETPEGSYNVVLFMSDEHNPKFSSIHGHPLVETPNMERLAKRGTHFVNGYCPSPLCMPSRCAFLTGRRVHEIQCYNNCNAIPFDYPDYGGVLKEQGIHSVHMGKLDGYRPLEDTGFSERIEAWTRKPPGDTNMRRDPLNVRKGSHKRAEGYGPKEEPWRGDDRIVNAALDWLRTKPQTLDKPFTLSVNINAPHFPHYVTPALWEKYADGANLPEHGPDEASANHPYVKDLREHFETGMFTDEDIRGLRRGYLGKVEYTDRQIGRFLDCLDETGLVENTVFIYASDHGEMLGKFGMWWKCSLYEDSVRVPILAAGPGFEAGKRLTTPVDLLDVQATFFRATGTQRPKDWTGTPLQDIPNQPSERPLFAEYHGHGTRASAYMIRQGDWKLIWYAEAPNQLFNMAKDPEELNNIIDDHPQKAAKLEEALREFCDPEKENRRAEAFIERQLDAVETVERSA